MNRIVFACLSILALAAAQALASGNAGDGNFGPYLQDATDTGIVVCWRTATAGTSEVEYGPTPNYGQTVSRLAAVQWHQVPITGLSPNALYYYRATTRVNGQSIWSETGSFRTNFKDDQPFTFVHTSETHDQDEVAKFQEEILGSKAHFILDASDQVDEGHEVEEWDHFFEIGESFYRHVTLYDVVGNHSYVGTGLFKTGIFGNLDTFRKVHAQPGNEEYFTFSYGKTEVFVLNSTWYYDPWRLSTTQIAWLEGELKKATDGVDDPTWKVASWHAPAYSSGPWYRNLLEKIWVQHFFVKRMKKYGIDLVLMGHDKFNEHSYVDGIHYVQVATGAISAKRVQSHNPGKVWLDATKRAITVIDVNGKKMDVRIVHTDGSTLHSFSLSKP